MVYELCGWPVGGGIPETLEASPERITLAPMIEKYGERYIALEVHAVAGPSPPSGSVDDRSRTIVSAWCKDWADDIAESKSLIERNARVSIQGS